MCPIIYTPGEDKTNNALFDTHRLKERCREKHHTGLPLRGDF